MASQKDVTYSAISKVADENNNFSREAAVAEIVNMWKSGELIYGDASTTEDDVKRYGSSLISNWLRKDVRLEGFAVNGSMPRAQTHSTTTRTPRTAKEPPKADEQMKKLVAAKALLAKEKLPTDDIDVMITLRQKELDLARSSQRESIMKKLAADLESIGIDLPTENANNAG